MPKTRLKITAALAASLALGGCAWLGQPLKLTLDLPRAWSEAPTPGAAVTPTWWTGFASSELDRLVEAALAESPDLAIAAARVTQAEATVTSAGASLFPSLNLSASTGRRHTHPGVGDSTGATLAIGYEIDLWGRLSAGRRSAAAGLAGSRHDLEAARLTLTSGVANAYFQVLATRARLAIARENLAIAERLLRIVDIRYRNGAASALDLSRQQTTVLTQRAAILPLEVQERQTASALAVLIGRLPEGFALADADLYALGIPQIAPFMPGELLARRPDLARAEAQLAAADANVDAARAALLPGLQLAASGSLGAAGLATLADPTRTTAITAALVQSIFDGGRLGSQVLSSEAQRRQLLETYRKAVITALKEVEDALANVVRYRDQEAAQLAIRDEAQRSLRLAELRYREGAIDLASFLDAQRTLYAAQDQLAQTRLARLAGAVDLAKALGGGWERERREAARKPQPSDIHG